MGDGEKFAELLQSGFELDYHISADICRPGYAEGHFWEAPAHIFKVVFLEKMAHLARPVFAVSQIRNKDDVVLEYAINGKSFAIDFQSADYRETEPDRSYLSKFLSELNRSVVEAGHAYHFVVIEDKRREGLLRVIVTLLPVNVLLHWRDRLDIVNDLDEESLKALSGTMDAGNPETFVPLRYTSLTEIVPAGRLIDMDGESVDDVKDYKTVLEDIAGITEGYLDFDTMTFSERNAVRQVVVTRGARSWTAELEGRTDWIDNDKLVPFLNEILLENGASKKIYILKTDDQSLRLAYATEKEADQLKTYRYMDHL